MIVAIDGPAASGKGTLARRLAAHFNFAYLDTGLLYRAVGQAVLDAGGDPANADDAEAAARAMNPEALDDDRLRSDAAGNAASQVAAIEGVRDALLDFQRVFARLHPHERDGAVLDGRDIGTVVCPDAHVKLFVTADVEERARRRAAEFAARGAAVEFDQVLTDLKVRDARDAARAQAPLKPAADAHLLDTTDLDIEAAFEQARDIVDAAWSPD
ncbi:cytidylate kinase [Rhodothalassium salexigens DSM 2132]|uniref:Cytidylate kinase n=1 Tax=Rhodothalassium salexigens DSM 2132 TaxID=1188247 RepID=A0A4R2PGJ6_RHOSA|nr:(d)CMP kinase [Rhodothalassium salexigens]MBB4211586.1 cytidylate kinase [Rhodothalassium salexigens DSM 2132]MBK1638394.1 cytidylate kinase [Rhodothalassium salexigens DSM 2132]TCP34482.1 cytidylate kinase [Rhodothalassium salexigens DSM 2132]